MQSSSIKRVTGYIIYLYTSDPLSWDRPTALCIFVYVLRARVCVVWLYTISLVRPSGRREREPKNRGRGRVEGKRDKGKQRVPFLRPSSSSSSSSFLLPPFFSKRQHEKGSLEDNVGLDDPDNVALEGQNEIFSRRSQHIRTRSH